MKQRQGRMNDGNMQDIARRFGDAFMSQLEQDVMVPFGTADNLQPQPSSLTFDRLMAARRQIEDSKPQVIGRKEDLDWFKARSPDFWASYHESSFANPGCIIILRWNKPAAIIYLDK